MVKTATPPPTSQAAVLDMSVPVSAEPVVLEKKAPKKKSKKDDAVAPVAVQLDSTDQPSDITDVSTDKSDASADLNEEVAELMRNIQARSALDNAIKVSAKAIEKKVAKLTKMIEKVSKKRKSSSNKVSGFEKPTAISDELAKFVGEPVGTLLARTAVSKKIHEYVKSNNLQNPSNRRIINPDAKLKKLLKTTGTDELSYFNLQKFLKVHFKKETKSA